MSAMDMPAEQPVAASRTRAAVPKTAFISWVALAMMTTSSVASLRAAPTMAVYGLACVFLYLVPAVVFLLPTSLVSAELASGYEGGIYKWVSQGISKPMGFLAVWCQFAMTIFYYPSLLGFVASTLAYVINPALATSGVWTAIVIVVVYWTGVWVSSRGTSGVAGLASMGLIIGTLIPGAVLIILAAVFLGQGNPSAAPMDASHLLPAWAGLSSLVLIVNNFLSYSGMEMNAVHVELAEEPRQGVPEGDVPGDGPGAGDLHPPGPGDQLGGARRPAVADRRCDAGLRRGVRRVRHPVADPDLRHHAGRRLARRDAHLAGRAVQGPAADLARRGLPAAVPPGS